MPLSSLKCIIASALGARWVIFWKANKNASFEPNVSYLDTILMPGLMLLYCCRNFVLQYFQFSFHNKNYNGFEIEILSGHIYQFLNQFFSVKIFFFISKNSFCSNIFPAVKILKKIFHIVVFGYNFCFKKLISFTKKNIKKYLRSPFSSLCNERNSCRLSVCWDLK